VDVNEPEIEKLATFATDEINSRSNSVHRLTLNRVVRAARQVVAGLQYRIVLELTAPGGRTEEHFVTVWDHFGTLKFVNHRICTSDEDCHFHR